MDKYIDNRKVKDDHKEGIDRIKMRKGDLVKGQGGKMGNGNASGNGFKRSGDKLTPRKA